MFTQQILQTSRFITCLRAGLRGHGLNANELLKEHKLSKWLEMELLHCVTIIKS